MAAARVNGVDLERYLCVTPGVEVSAQSQAAALELAAMLGERGTDDAPDGGETCPLCALTVIALLALPATAVGPPRINAAAQSLAYATGLVHRLQGPPVGSRGPPLRA